MIITKEYLEKFNQVVEDEIWKDYPFDNNIQVSSWGNVRKGDVLYNLYSDCTGYTVCGCSYVCTKFVHRLVAIVFIPCPGDMSEYQVDHIDFNRGNSYIHNLQWLTRIDNCRRSYERVCKVNKELNGIHVVELRSGNKYDSIVDIANTFNDGTLNKRVSNISNGMYKYFGYVPQYDIIVFEEDNVPDTPVTDVEIKGLRFAAKGVYSNRPAIYCKTLDRWFPSIPETARQLNFSIQYFRDVFEKFSGYYSKYQLYFEKVPWDEVPDSEVLNMKPFIVDGFTSRKGNYIQKRNLIGNT